MSALKAAKRDLRKRLRVVLSQVPKESMVTQSTITTNKLLTLPEYHAARRISVYLSMPSGEISTSAIVRDALARGKKVFVPYIHKGEDTGHAYASVMDMLALQSLEELEGLPPDAWGIPTLPEDTIASRCNCLGGHGVHPVSRSDGAAGGEDVGLDLIVMPGMAFDEERRRLGHGKGYYDHFLNRYADLQLKARPRPFLAALALGEQIIHTPEQIPVADHDWAVDSLIVGDGRVLTRTS